MSELPQHVERRVVDGDAAITRLKGLHLTYEIIEASIQEGDAHRRRTSFKFYPAIYPGITMWAETTASLRAQLIARRDDWQAGRTGNYETVYHPHLRIAFAVVGGDSQTGVLDGLDPKLARKRGPKTTERIERNAVINAQYELALEFPPTSPDVPDDEQCQTWFILTYPDVDEMRVEVSLPVSIGVDGRVDRWRERIILSPIAISGGVRIENVGGEDDDDDDTQIVRRPQ